MSSIYLAGYTIQFNNFYNLFPKCDRKRGSVFLFVEYICVITS